MSDITVSQQSQIVLLDSPTAAIRDRLIPSPEANKNIRSRLQHFVSWLEQNATDWRSWLVPDLAAYADYAMSDERSSLDGELIAPLSARSMNAHLSTIRGQYAAIKEDRDLLYSFIPDTLDYANRRAMAEELLDRMAGALSPKRVKVTEVKVQDTVDSQQLRLTQRQAEELIAAPYRRKQNSPLKALRDSALFALMLATGIREDEAVNLRVSDLRQRKEGELVLLVRKGKGSKQRTIPYGENDGVLVLVDRWLERSGINDFLARNAGTDAYVFPAFKSLKSSAEEIEPFTHITTRSLQRTLALYPVLIDGKQTTITPHDLRRTYARREHDAGTPLTAIQQNLGHKDIKTTMGYIGDLDFKQRRGRAAYDWQGLLPSELQ